jgi:hypothetical protein
MTAIKGTQVLLYSNGQAIAMQKGLNFGWDCSLENATNKESAGWAEFIVGIMNAQIDFTALYGTGLMTDNPKVLSGKDLIDYIRNSTELLVAILGGTYPIVGKANMKSISLSADNEQPMALTGNLKINGAMYQIGGAMANKLTDPNGTFTDYDTFTKSGTAITSAINAAGGALAESNTFAVLTAEVYKVAFYLTKTSGELPSFLLYENGVADRSNTVAAVEGLNLMTLTVSASATVLLKIVNTGAANWKTSPIYVFKV